MTTTQPGRDDADPTKPQDTSLASTPSRENDSALKLPSVKDDGKQTMSLIMLLLATFAFAVFLFSLLGRFFYYAELMCNFRLVIATILIPFALVALRIGRWRWLTWGLTIAIAWSFLTIGSIYLPAAQPPAGPKKMKIMSFNVLGLNRDRDAVIAEMRRANADVIVVVEYNHDWHRRLSGLESEYPHRVLQPRWHGFGLAVFSKHPLTDTTVIQLTKELTDNPTIITHVNYGQQKIRICGVHALSPTNSYRLDMRNKQYIEIAEELLKEDVPTVVMGDFNSVPWAPFLSDFIKATGYRDSRQGIGFHASWHAERLELAIPIDHAFVSTEICVHSRTLGNSAGSDHLPVIFEVSAAQ